MVVDMDMGTDTDLATQIDKDMQLDLRNGHAKWTQAYQGQGYDKELD